MHNVKIIKEIGTHFTQCTDRVSPILNIGGGGGGGARPPLTPMIIQAMHSDNEKQLCRVGLVPVAPLPSCIADLCRSESKLG